MTLHKCRRASEISHRRTELDSEWQAHMESCRECREVWLVSRAMKSLAANAPSDPHPAASVTRLLVLAEVTGKRREEQSYLLQVSAYFAIVLVIWAGLVWLGASHFPHASFMRGVVPAAAALGAALWASTGSRSEAGEY